MTRPSAASPTKARPSCETCGGCSLTYEACVRARASRPRPTKRWPSAASSAARSRGVTAPPGRPERGGGWGAMSGPPCAGARSRRATAPPGRPERWGVWGAISGPPCAGARSRRATAPPGRPERGGVWGAISGPPCAGARSRRATAPPGRPERWGGWGAISGPPISSGPVLAEGQRRVGAAEAEGVRQRRLDVLLARLVRDVVEVAVRVGRLVVDRGRQHAVIEREHRGDRLDAAGGAEEVARHRLGRRHGQLARVVAEDALDGDGLELVVVRRRGAVGVDVA